jgi:hypothetical protein
MANKKRAKTRAKPAKPKKKKKVVSRKPATRIKARITKKKPKKAGKKTAARTRPKKAPKARRAVAPRPRPAAPAAAATRLTTPPPGGVRIGVVTHYFSHLSVAIIRIESGSLREGDYVHIKGHTSDFSQRVASMEVEHMHVSEVFPGQSFGLKVREHAREHDIVYKTAAL